MKGEVEMTVPELVLVLGIRASLGIGLGLVLANCFSSAEKRSVAGRTLLGAGLFAGACLGTQIFGRRAPFKLTFSTDAHVAQAQRQREESAAAAAVI